MPISMLDQNAATDSKHPPLQLNDINIIDNKKGSFSCQEPFPMD